jgi:hypothetical protein
MRTWKANRRGDVSNRIVSGFSWLGIGGAVLLSFGGRAATTMMVASDQYFKAELESGVGRIPGVIGDQSPTALVAAPIDQRPRGLADVEVRVAPSPAAVATKTSAVGLGVTALVTLAAFGFFRVLGWVVAGFAGARLR